MPKRSMMKRCAFLCAASAALLLGGACAARAASEAPPHVGVLEAQKKAAEDERRKKEEAERKAKAAAQKAQTAKKAEAKPKPAPAQNRAGKTYKNTIDMEFVLIPAGTFQMGCMSAEESCWREESPRHQVRIARPFYLGKYEVSQKQWETIMGINTSKFKEANHPVENVSWDEVQEFVRKLNVKEGHTRYRLPTEAEWEYAARAGSGAAYCFGSAVGPLGEYAWFYGNSGEETHAVGQKKPNAWGLYDMHGNVWEWVEDRYGDYSSGSVIDPRGPSEGEARVLRGGSWDSPARSCRSANRFWLTPDNNIDGGIGFRLALSPEP